MTKIISVNAGSSSLKFQLFDMPQETVLTSGVIERIGLDEGIFTIKVNGEKKTIKQPILDHTVAVKLLLDALVEYKIVDHLDEIKGAGHRAVHGGEIFTDSVKVDDDVVAKFESLSDLAPLHNPANIIGINLVSVLQFAYGSVTGRETLRDSALTLLERLPAEDNRYMRNWRNTGVMIRNAFESQALLQLATEYCPAKRCTECPVGRRILQSISSTE